MFSFISSWATGFESAAHNLSYLLRLHNPAGNQLYFVVAAAQQAMPAGFAAQA
jgi:hypothetical protein